MKSQILTVLLASSLFSLSVESQTLTREDLRLRGEIGLHKPYTPQSMDSLVGSSTLIVKGSYGKFLGSSPFYGYSEDGEDITMEEFSRRSGYPLEEAHLWAVPVSEYEVHVDEVWMGETEERTIILRKYESPDTDRPFVDSDAEWLFFMVINPDNRTYGIKSEAASYSNINGQYYHPVYRYDTPFGRPTLVWETPDFMPTDAESVEELVKYEIQRQARFSNEP